MQKLQRFRPPLQWSPPSQRIGHRVKSSKRKIEPQTPIRDICKIAKALFGAQSAIVDCRIGDPVKQILENVHAEEEAHASIQERRQRPRGLEAVIRVEGTVDSEESRHFGRSCWGGKEIKEDRVLDSYLGEEVVVVYAASQSFKFAETACTR